MRTKAKERFLLREGTKKQSQKEKGFLKLLLAVGVGTGTTVAKTKTLSSINQIKSLVSISTGALAAAAASGGSTAAATMN